MLPNDNVLMSVRHLDQVLLTVHSSMEHVTWKSPGPMCGWVGRILLHPNSCTSVSSWSKVLLLSIWSVTVPLCRPLLPCSGRWHGSLPRHGLWWLPCELHCSPLPWKLGPVYQLWTSPLLSCVPWSSDQTSCLSLQHNSWSSSCKGHNRSKFLNVRWGRLAVAMLWDFRILANASLSSFTWHDNLRDCLLCFLLSLLRPSKISPRCFVWPYRWSREGSRAHLLSALATCSSSFFRSSSSVTML